MIFIEPYWNQVLKSLLIHIDRHRELIQHVLLYMIPQHHWLGYPLNMLKVVLHRVMESR